MINTTKKDHQYMEYGDKGSIIVYFPLILKGERSIVIKQKEGNQTKSSIRTIPVVGETIKDKRSASEGEKYLNDLFLF